MTIQEAIENLEERKAFLQRTCEHCWDDAIEMALQALKEKKYMIHCKYCKYYGGNRTCGNPYGMVVPTDYSYCSQAVRKE